MCSHSRVLARRPRPRAYRAPSRFKAMASPYLPVQGGTFAAAAAAPLADQLAYLPQGPPRAGWDASLKATKLAYGLRQCRTSLAELLGDHTELRNMQITEMGTYEIDELCNFLKDEEIGRPPIESLSFARGTLAKYANAFMQLPLPKVRLLYALISA